MGRRETILRTDRLSLHHFRFDKKLCIIDFEVGASLSINKRSCNYCRSIGDVRTKNDDARKESAMNILSIKNRSRIKIKENHVK